jgi:hypothetical protein
MRKNRRIKLLHRAGDYNKALNCLVCYEGNSPLHQRYPVDPVSKMRLICGEDCPVVQMQFRQTNGKWELYAFNQFLAKIVSRDSLNPRVVAKNKPYMKRKTAPTYPLILSLERKYQKNKFVIIQKKIRF